MVSLICGEKGKGKTKTLLEKVNEVSQSADGNVIYIDKDSKKMYELNNKIRLINMTDYPISNNDEFVGFLCGIISQDHDIEEIFLDSFLTISHVKDEYLEHTINKLSEISTQYQVNFEVSISKKSEDLPQSLQDIITVAL